MKGRTLNIVVWGVVGLLFLWLAFRNIELTELWAQIKTVSYYWVPFFVVILAFSHYLRAERWRLLMPAEYQNISRSTLYAGVMLGYMVNNVVPRLGEISRPVYVARKEKVDTGNLVGTVVAERLFDLFVLIILAFVAVFVFVSDPSTVQKLLGIEEWRLWHYLVLPLFFGVLVGAIWLFYRIILLLDNRFQFSHPFLTKLLTAVRSFGDGVLSLRKVKNWPLFLLLTGGIWSGYIMMTYLPFYMLDFQNLFGLDIIDGAILTVVSSVGVSIPVPAAVGSYHLLMQQSMWVFYSIPLSQGLTYATVVHAAMILFVFIVGAFSLWWDKFYTLAVTKKR